MRFDKIEPIKIKNAPKYISILEYRVHAAPDADYKITGSRGDGRKFEFIGRGTTALCKMFNVNTSDFYLHYESGKNVRFRSFFQADDNL